MKRHNITTMSTLCAVFLAGSLLAQGTSGKPKAVVAEPVEDVGVVAKGDKIVHDFAIRNDGASELLISEVAPACGCTVAEFDKSIAPGKAGKVHAVLDTSTFSGPIAKGIYVFTNDPDNPRLELTIRAKVEPSINVRPGYARFVKADPEGLGAVEQLIWSPDGTAFDIVRIENPYGAFLKVEHRAATDADRAEAGVEGGGHVVTLTLDYGAAPVGSLAQYVSVHTSHPKQKVVQIPITGFVRPLVAVTPQELDLGQVSLAEPVRHVINVQSFAAQPMAVTSVENDLGTAEASVRTLKEGKEFQVLLTLNPGMPKGEFAGKVKIHTDNPKRPIIEVPVRGTVI